MEQPTRIIPQSASLQGGHAANILRLEPDPGLIKMGVFQGRESITGGDQETAQRFGSEVKYVTYFAQRLAESLGMRQLQLGIVEDREGQTAFVSSSSGWHGSVSSNRRSLRQLCDSLVRH